jgi:hypothetical protein
MFFFNAKRMIIPLKRQVACFLFYLPRPAPSDEENDTGIPHA